MGFWGPYFQTDSMSCIPLEMWLDLTVTNVEMWLVSKTGLKLHMVCMAVMLILVHTIQVCSHTSRKAQKNYIYKWVHMHTCTYIYTYNERERCVCVWWHPSVINEVSNKAAKANCFKTNKKLEIVGAHRKPEDVSQQKKWMIQIYSKCHLSPRARLAWKKKVQTKAPIRHSQTRVRRNQRMDSGQICLEAINADFILCFWTSLWLTVTSMYLIYHSKYLQIHILSLKNCSNLNGSFSEVPTGAAWLGKGFGRGLEPMLVSSLTSLILFNPISNNFCPIIFKVLKLNVRGGQKISQESDTSILVKFQRASTYPFRVRSRELGFARVSRCWSALRWRFWLTPPQETGKTCTNRYVALCVCVGMMSAHKYCTYKDTYTYVTYVYIYTCILYHYRPIPLADNHKVFANGWYLSDRYQWCFICSMNNMCGTWAPLPNPLFSWRNFLSKVSADGNAHVTTSRESVAGVWQLFVPPSTATALDPVDQVSSCKLGMQDPVHHRSFAA